MPDFMLMALIAGCGVALLAGPLGAFAVWRRMAYFGDTLAHASLTGVAFGLMLSVNTHIALTLFCLLLALVLVALQQKRALATDTLLGIMSHSMLALGLVVISLFGEGRVDLYAFLFGDLLAVTEADLITLALTATIIVPLLIWLWRPLLAITVHEELAQVEGIPVMKVKAALMLMMALLVAVAMKAVGILLITALLIIPAAASRRLSSTPEQMALLAGGIGALSIVGGLSASFFWDTPAGPSAVLCTSMLFLLALTRKVSA